MTRDEWGRRSFMGATVAGGFGLAGTGAGAGAGSAKGSAPSAALHAESTFDLHATVTYRALVDAVVPETESLGERLGAVHAPGGLDIGLAAFLIEYVDGLFSFDPGFLAEDGNLQLSGPIAHALDTAARTLVLRGENESRTRTRRALSLFDDDTEHSRMMVLLAAGPFARLTREDRLRAIGLLDDLEVEVSPTEDSLFELDGGMLGQLVIGFTELIYYGEWEGYADYDRPPSEREHPNDPAAVQGWRQTDFPGYAPGNAALRGYLGTANGSLGSGEVWTVVDESAAEPIELRFEPGDFRENDYDTSGYEEPYPEEPGEFAETGGEDESGEDESDTDDSDDDADDFFGGWFGGWF